MLRSWDTDLVTSRGRLIASYTASALALWIVALVIVGALYGDRAAARVTRRVSDSLAAEVTVESSNLALVRGRLELGGFKVRKDDLGMLSIDVASIDCDLPPLGLALVDRTCRDLVIDRVRLEVSTLAVFRFKKPKQRPFRAERVELRDAVLAFSPSAFVPDLGKVEVDIDHVVAGETTFKTPLSWVFAMRELRATIDLPGGVVVKLHYDRGVLRASGSIFGGTPVELPLALPVADAADDAQAEIKKLVAFGRDLAEQLVARRAKDWLKSKLPF